MEALLILVGGTAGSSLCRAEGRRCECL